MKTGWPVCSWRVLVTLVVAFVVFLPGAAEAEDDPRGFIESIAEGVYQMAWPTATYESVAIQAVEPAVDGFDILVKLSGRSGFSGGPLWMVLVVELRHGNLHDIRVSRHNALLSPPFATAEALGQAIAELNEGQGYRFYVSNMCRHPIRLAIRYKRLDDTWVTEGWWEFPAGSARYLSYKEGGGPRTRSSVVYYFAETTDRKVTWSGGRDVPFDERTLPMVTYEDTAGDTELSLSCAGF